MQPTTTTPPVAAVQVPPPPPADVLASALLQRRPSRVEDYRSECAALGRLAQLLADSPGLALQAVVDTVLQVVVAGSAGVSLLSRDGSRFFRQVVAGDGHGYAGRQTDPTMERHAGCRACCNDGLWAGG